ncbi:hypothetical protein GCK32_019931, partial [Trichostrongylus colubriformis]
MIEQLLAEAASDKLMHPASHLGGPVHALAAQVERMGLGRHQNGRRVPNPPPQRRFRLRLTQGETQAGSGVHSDRFGASNTASTVESWGISRGNARLLELKHTARSGAMINPQDKTTSPDPVLVRDHSEPQSEAKNSQAQVAALLKRNYELSQSAFYGNSSQSLLNGSCLMPADASSSFLCPRDSHDQLLRIPFTYNCSNIMPPPGADIVPLSLNIFRPNTKRYSSSAFLCKIITVFASFSVNFFGSRSIVRTENVQTVSLEHCWMMATHH